MIGKLKGILDSVSDGLAVIDVHGVGYLISISARTLGALPPIGQSVNLVIETHVREDKLQLFGFIDAAERDLFRTLQTVQGVGPKAALSILSTLSPDQLLQAIIAQDKSAVAEADGVGPKLAARVVMELKDKLGNLSLGGSASVKPINLAKPARAQEEAISALINLGYGRSEAFAAVAALSNQLKESAKVEDIIPLALKELAA
ncbi:MAG: Holliday junction branch migration protein RuvA [Dongiaceae bacterium]